MFKEKNMDYKELECWYNGYMTATGIKVYNPRTVVLALSNNHCQSYWTNTGAMDEVLEYLKYNILDVRDDVIRMVNGDEVEIEIDESVDVALNQIKEKEYYLKFKKEYKDRDILLVAISYDSKSKEHSCKIEKI